MSEEPEDDGVTLVELVVSMTVMSIFMGLFTAAAIQMFRFETSTEVATSAKTQIHIAYLRLDKDIRYASGISTPTASYVEYLRTDLGSPLCTELWLDTAGRRLLTRSWTQGSTPSPTWSVLVSGASAATPFTLLNPVAPVTAQRLRITLAVAPAGASGPTRTMDSTFTAQSTSASTSSATVCTEGRSAP